MQTQPFSLSSDAIDQNKNFDPRYTCDLDNSSPELRWENAPEGTQSFALIAEDPDAPHGMFVHWVIYHIPQDVKHLPAGIPSQESLPNGIRQGLNGYGKLGYAGPCPPIGDRPHRYYFHLFALGKIPQLAPRLSKADLLNAIQPHILAEAQLMGVYQRMIQNAG